MRLSWQPALFGRVRDCIRRKKSSARRLWTMFVADAVAAKAGRRASAATAGAAPVREVCDRQSGPAGHQGVAAGVARARGSWHDVALAHGRGSPRGVCPGFRRGVNSPATVMPSLREA